MRGRKPTPTVLRVIDGNPGKRPLPKGEPIPKNDLSAEPPSHLSPEQAAIWREVMEEAPAGLFKGLDKALLESWVVSCSLHRAAVLEYNRTGGMFTRTRNGEVIQNPYIGVINRQAGIMQKLGSEMGFSPSARTRISLDPADPGAGNPFNRFRKE